MEEVDVEDAFTTPVVEDVAEAIIMPVKRRSRSTKGGYVQL
jgi:hypothetical protein